jgi:hypothetical protein
MTAYERALAYCAGSTVMDGEIEPLDESSFSESSSPTHFKGESDFDEDTKKVHWSKPHLH